MHTQNINQCLAAGSIDQQGVFPHIDQLMQCPFVFSMNFGLDVLPTEPGIIMIRGARQYGKSTWLEQALKASIEQFGKGSAYYLNGDYLLESHRLESAITDLLPSFHKDAAIKRIFIDEITAIPSWEQVLKRLADSGQLRDILIVTTGSNALDLRRGAERLPGRKGKLARTRYLFTPISYDEFYRVCHDHLKENTLPAYMLSGGSPIACAEIAQHSSLPEYVVELARDWIDGEFARTGRTRQAIYNVMTVIFKCGGTPLGQAKLAREAGLANNTIAANYVELMNDLGIVLPSFAWDADKHLPILRKPCKYHITNLLAALAFYPAGLRRIEQMRDLPAQEQAIWLEWLVAQEEMRRAAIAGKEILSPQRFWQSKTHEIDFVTADGFLEVKRGKCTALEFVWFAKQFPNQTLTVITNTPFEARNVRGISMEQYLMEQ